MPLDLLPAFLMAALACWLGLSLLVRSPRDRAARSFAWLSLHLTIYALAIVLGRLTRSPLIVQPVVHRIEIVEIVLLPPVFLQFIIVITAVPRLVRFQQIALIVAYAVGIAMAIYALLSPYMILISPPRYPEGPLVLVALLQRAVPLLFALALTLLRYRQASDDHQERQRRGVFAIASLIAISGALLASVARELDFIQSPGHLLMDVGLAMLAYMVLAYQMLLPIRVARRTFYRSLLGGVFTALYIMLLCCWSHCSARHWRLIRP